MTDGDILARANNEIHGLTLAGDYLYFTEADWYLDRFGPDSCSEDGWIRRVHRRGGPIETLASEPDLPGDVIVADDWVVWETRAPEGYVCGLRAVQIVEAGRRRTRSSSVGSMRTRLASHRDEVFWAEARTIKAWSPRTGRTRTVGRTAGSFEVDDLAVVGDAIVASIGRKLVLFAIRGGRPRVLISGARFECLAVQGSMVYAAREVERRTPQRHGNWEIIRLDTAVGGTRPQVIRETPGRILELAADRTYLYYTVDLSPDGYHGRHALHRIDRTGRDPREIAAAAWRPLHHLLVDEDALYFEHDDRVWRVRTRPEQAWPQASAHLPRNPTLSPSPRKPVALGKLPAPKPDPRSLPPLPFLLTLQVDPVDGQIGTPTELVARLQNRSAFPQVINSRMLLNHAGAPGEVLVEVQGPPGYSNRVGFRIRVGPAEPRLFVRLEPGASIEQTWRLDRYQSLDVPGSYLVTVTYHNESERSPDGRPMAVGQAVGRIRMDRRA
jgi:hypothetical protein